ncbi:MAG: hypothetical protein LIP09_11995 [Bacteroidales bacterium]|nr:hypothetical protein [Bacteroidales bacterium]
MKQTPKFQPQQSIDTTPMWVKVAQALGAIAIAFFAFAALWLFLWTASDMGIAM